MRYRQELGTYQRPNYAMTPAQSSNAASSAYVKLEDKTKHRHDGLYFRFGLGVGRAHDSMSTAEPIQTDREITFFPTPFDGSGTATSPVTELAFGYAVGAGVTLGVGSYTATLSKLTTEAVQRETGPYVFRLSQLALIGPLIDWYFDEESGFHAEACPGVSTYVAGAGEPKIEGPQAQAHTAVGFGFMLGVGYDWWVSDQWSIGLLGRIQYGTMNGTAPTPDGSGVEFHHTAYAPAVLVTATYQ
jgi:hypothetical protein